MKKVISVLLALLMMFSLASVGTVAFAEDAETPVAAEEDATSNARGAVSDYIPFSYECDYCGQSHEGFIGILMTMFHTMISAIKLAYTAVKR